MTESTHSSHNPAETAQDGPGKAEERNRARSPTGRASVVCADDSSPSGGKRVGVMDIQTIRRMAEDGLPTPPWLVLALCERVEGLETGAHALLTATAKCWTKAGVDTMELADAEQAMQALLEGDQGYRRIT